MVPVRLSWSQIRTEYAKKAHLCLLIFITTLIALLYYFWAFLGFRPNWLWHLIATEFQFQFIGSLFYIPAVYCAITFRWRGMLIMGLVVVSLTMPLAIYYRPRPIPVLINIFYLIIPLLVIGYVTLEMNWRKKEQRTLIEREEERQAYLAQVFQAQEDERKRIAQEIHDDAIQSLILVANSVREISYNKSNRNKEQIQDQANAIRDEIIRVSDDLRRLTLDLRPGIIDNIGFVPALRWLVDRINQDGHINAQILIKGEERKISDKSDVTLYRIVQEALNNVLLHSAATKTNVELEFSSDRVKILIRDNGKGFSLPKRINTFAMAGRLGILGIQERVRALNGTFIIKSSLGKGTTISVEFKDTPCVQ
jgi:signal transduction histidine kinase